MHYDTTQCPLGNPVNKIWTLWGIDVERRNYCHGAYKQSVFDSERVLTHPLSVFALDYYYFFCSEDTWISLLNRQLGRLARQAYVVNFILSQSENHLSEHCESEISRYFQHRLFDFKHFPHSLTQYSSWWQNPACCSLLPWSCSCTDSFWWSPASRRWRWTPGSPSPPPEIRVDWNIHTYTSCQIPTDTWNMKRTSPVLLDVSQLMSVPPTTN